MTVTKEISTTQPLTLPEELILMLLNEENGYFHQVPGWDLNCAVVGAVLAELSLPIAHRHGSWNHYSLWIRQKRATPPLDPILKEIASESRSTECAQYWIERLAPRAGVNY